MIRKSEIHEAQSNATELICVDSKDLFVNIVNSYTLYVNSYVKRIYLSKPPFYDKKFNVRVEVEIDRRNVRSILDAARDVIEELNVQIESIGLIGYTLIH